MAHAVDFYLSQGCERKAAEYFASGRKKITSVVANDNFTLTLHVETVVFMSRVK